MYLGGEILYKNLSYQVQGVLIEIKKMYGLGRKESVYCNAIEELFLIKNIPYEREKSLQVYSPISGKVMGLYRPDFLIDNKIILEVKAVDIIPGNFIDQLYSYLRVSKYELGIFVNFKSDNLYIKRIIFTNDRKSNKKVDV